MQSVQKRWYDDASYEDTLPEEERVADDAPGSVDEKIYVASYLQLMWWRFLRHRMAVISAVIVILLYFTAAFAEFVAPYNPENSFVRYKLAPPTSIHMIDAEGNLRRPFVYRMNRERDPETLRNIYIED